MPIDNVLLILKSRGKRPRHLEAFLTENQLPYIMYCPEIQGSSKRFRTSAESQSPLANSWASHLRLLTLPADDEELRPAVFQPARKPPALIHLRLQLAACGQKGG